MATSVLPALIAALVDALESAPGDFRAHYGPMLSAELGTVVQVHATREGASNTIGQSPASMGTPRGRAETGPIPCLIWALTGDIDGNQAATEDAFAAFAALEDVLRVDPTVGVTPVNEDGYIQVQVSSYSFELFPTPDGVIAEIAVTLTYESQI